MSFSKSDKSENEEIVSLNKHEKLNIKQTSKAKQNTTNLGPELNVS